jgi:tetratricopeptide (TPR) repeat protein
MWEVAMSICTRYRTLASNRARGILTIVFYLFLLTPSFPQVKTSEKCSPVVISTGGVSSLDIRCPTTVVTNVSYVLSPDGVSSVASYYGITTVAVQNLFQQIDGEHVPPYLLGQRLELLATEIKRLRQELAAISVTESAKRLWTEAMRALDDGKVEQAIEIHKQLVAKMGSPVQAAFNTLLDAARFERSLGQLYELTYKYEQAARQYESADGKLPASFKMEHARLKTLWAGALSHASSSDPDEVLKLARDAVSITGEMVDADPELHLRALSVELQALIITTNQQEALKVFDNRITPLLDNPQLRGSAWGLLCFSCVGKAFIDLENYEAAARILRKGVQYSKSRISPDKVALSAIYNNLAGALFALNDRKNASDAREMAKNLLLEAFPNEGHPNFAYLYLNIGIDTDDDVKKSEAYVRAFRVAATVYPYTDESYQGILTRIVKDPAGELNLVPVDPQSNGPTTITIGAFDPNAEFYAQLYSLHMQNARSVSTDLETLANASLYFAHLLVRGRREEQSLKYYKATAALYPPGSVGFALGESHYVLAQLLDIKRLGSDSDAESAYKSAIAVFLQATGNMSEYSPRRQAEICRVLCEPW